jgi:hypothetical protein
MMNDSPSNFRKKIHVPMTDIDDIPFNKQDPKFVAQMSIYLLIFTSTKT